MSLVLGTLRAAEGTHFLAPENIQENVISLSQQYDSLVVSESNENRGRYNPLWLDERIFLEEDSLFDDTGRGPGLVGTPTSLQHLGMALRGRQPGLFDGRATSSSPYSSRRGGYTGSAQKQKLGLATDPFAPVLSPFPSAFRTKGPTTPVTRMMEQAAWLAAELKDVEPSPSDSLRSLLLECDRSLASDASAVCPSPSSSSSSSPSSSSSLTSTTTIPSTTATTTTATLSNTAHRTTGRRPNLSSCPCSCSSSSSSSSSPSIMDIVQDLSNKLILPGPTHHNYFSSTKLNEHRKQLAVKLYYRVLQRLLR